MKARSKSKADPRWVPILQAGGVFCSPACGFKCTRTAYDAAHQKATVLAAKLEKTYGGEWSIRVWENMGWYYNVSCGVLVVHPYQHGTKPPSGGTVFFNGVHQFVTDYRSDPRNGIVKVVDRATRFAMQLQDEVAEVLP